MDTPPSADLPSPSGSGSGGGTETPPGQTGSNDNPSLMLSSDQADSFGLTGKKDGDTVTLKVMGKVNSGDDGGISLDVLSATPMDDDSAPDADGTVKDANALRAKPRVLSPKESGFPDMG